MTGRYGWLLGKGVVVQSIVRKAFWIPELPLALSWLALALFSLLVLGVEKAAGHRAMSDKRVRRSISVARQSNADPSAERRTAVLHLVPQHNSILVTGICTAVIRRPCIDMAHCACSSVCTTGRVSVVLQPCYGHPTDCDNPRTGSAP